jgi:RNA polymerase sigma-32 factor
MAKKLNRKTKVAKKSARKAPAVKPAKQARAKAPAKVKVLEPEVLEPEDTEEVPEAEDLQELEKDKEIESDDEAPESEEVTSLAVSEPEGSIQRFTALQHYLSEVRKYPLLTREEEQELARRFHERGDKTAARKLVTSNLRLVVKIALEYYRQWMDLLDLIQEGNLGLMQAVKKFDPYRGIRLSTYSSFWIRAYILKFLMDNWRLVKIGTTQAQRKLFFNLKKERERLEKFGFKPGSKILAEALSVKESEVQEMDQRLSSRDESLETPVSEDGKQTREMLLPDTGPQVDEALADDEFSRIVRRKLEVYRRTLNEPGKEKEAFIFDNRLLSDQPLTLQEVGEKFNISRERVRQLESRLIKQLREYFKEQLPDFENYQFILQ